MRVTEEHSARYVCCCFYTDNAVFENKTTKSKSPQERRAWVLAVTPLGSLTCSAVLSVRICPRDSLGEAGGSEGVVTGIRLQTKVGRTENVTV